MNVLQVLGYGGTVAAIGLLIVFAGLLILIVAITIMAKIFDFINASAKAKQEAAEKAAAAAAPAMVKEPEPEPVVEEEVTDDPALIAVIAAAIAAYDNSGKLVIRKVRRVSGWNRSARAEQVTSF